MYKRYINAIIYLFIYFYVDWSGMVYSPTVSSDLLMILGCMTSNFFYLRFSTLYFSSFGRTDTIVFAKLNKAVARGG